MNFQTHGKAENWVPALLPPTAQTQRSILTSYPCSQSLSLLSLSFLLSLLSSLIHTLNFLFSKPSLASRLYTCCSFYPKHSSSLFLPGQLHSQPSSFTVKCHFLHVPLGNPHTSTKCSRVPVLCAHCHTSNTSTFSLASSSPHPQLPSLLSQHLQLPPQLYLSLPWLSSATYTLSSACLSSPFIPLSS